MATVPEQQQNVEAEVQAVKWELQEKRKPFVFLVKAFDKHAEETRSQSRIWATFVGGNVTANNAAANRVSTGKGVC